MGQLPCVETRVSWKEFTATLAGRAATNWAWLLVGSTPSIVKATLISAFSQLATEVEPGADTLLSGHGVEAVELVGQYVSAGHWTWVAGVGQ